MRGAGNRDLLASVDGPVLDPSFSLEVKKGALAQDGLQDFKNLSNLHPEGAEVSLRVRNDMQRHEDWPKSPPGREPAVEKDQTTTSSMRLVSVPEAEGADELLGQGQTRASQGRTMTSSRFVQPPRITGKEILSIIGKFRNNDISQYFQKLPATVPLKS